MEVVEVNQTQQEYILAITELESRIFSDSWSAGSIQETLENPQAKIWVVQSPDAEEVLGYVIFYYVLDEGEIARIATAPEYRRQGVAAKLLEKMRVFSHQKNITRWLLDVRRSNETAIHFYETSGFVQDGIRKNFYANPIEDAILMSCEVGNELADLTVLPTGKFSAHQV